MKGKRILLFLWLCIMLSVIILGVVLFSDRQYAAISALVMLLSCIPFFVRFEGKKMSSAEISLLAVMVALSVLGRFVFAPLPFFKPVTAMVIITGVYIGAEHGFICGAATALISNFYFGQGPWTPFQMFSWGIIGLLAGVFSVILKKNKTAMCIYGALSGIVFSLLMDVWSGMWMDGSFLLSRYIANVITALPVTVVYMVSNVIFLLVLARPLGRKIEHTKIKWGYK